MPSYEPRALQGIGITYSTSPMGADHTAGYAVAANLSKISGSSNPLQYDGQVEVFRNYQVITAALDGADLCMFEAFSELDNKEGLSAIPNIINARHSRNISLNDFKKYDQKIITTERMLNKKSGFSMEHDRFSHFIRKKRLPSHNTVFDVPDEEIDSLFELLK